MRPDRTGPHDNAPTTSPAGEVTAGLVAGEVVTAEVMADEVVTAEVIADEVQALVVVAEVLATGPTALLQDAGRPGYAHLGVTASGAADRGAYAAANRLVGNTSGAATIETVFGGLRLRVRGPSLWAVTGAPTWVVIHRSTPSRVPSAESSAARSPAAPTVEPTGYSFFAEDGDIIEVLQPELGLRNYLAVRGGLGGDDTLGSRSTDLLSGLGPAPLRVGDLLFRGTEDREWPAATHIPPPITPPGTGGPPDPVGLTIVRGPRDDWFGEQGWQTLIGTVWAVAPDSNRVGVRLVPQVTHDTPAPRDELRGNGRIERAQGYEGELPSEGMVPGAVQMPPSGQPLVFLRDHPVTGGYPVIGVLTAAATDLLAQLRPGDLALFAAAPG